MHASPAVAVPQPKILAGPNFPGKWSGWKKEKPRTLSPGFTPDAAFVA
jgi:hypothetical protein